jgi:hypothetical protein
LAKTIVNEISASVHTFYNSHNEIQQKLVKITTSTKVQKLRIRALEELSLSGTEKAKPPAHDRMSLQACSLIAERIRNP